MDKASATNKITALVNNQQDDLRRSDENFLDRDITTSVNSHLARLHGDNIKNRMMILIGDLVFYNQFIKLAALKIGLNKKIRILDIGCGKGENLELFAKFYSNSEIIGIDLNDASLTSAKELLKHYKNVIIKKYDIMTMDNELEKESFDLVICSEVYEHVTEPQKLIQACNSMLKKGGVLLFSTPSAWMYRLPRISNLYLIYKAPIKYWKLYLNPEKNWQEALAIHPAISPRVLKKQLQKSGFKSLYRESSCYFIFEPTSIIWKLGNIFNPKIIWNFYMCMEGLMNLIPLFRFLESRQIHLCIKD